MPNDEQPQNIHEAYRTLSSIPYFAALNADCLQVVSQMAIRRTYDTGEMVLLEGDTESGLYVVQDGWLKAFKASSEGREQILFLLGPGEFFNAMSVFADAPFPVSVVALEPVNIWIIAKDVMIRLVMQSPDLALSIIRSLAGHVLHLTELVEDLSLRTIEARLARYLLENAVEKQSQRQHWTTQAEIASRIGTVPDVVNRALRNLVAERLVEVKRHQIQILNREGLEAKAKRAT